MAAASQAPADLTQKFRCGPAIFVRSAKKVPPTWLDRWIQAFGKPQNSGAREPACPAPMAKRFTALFGTQPSWQTRFHSAF